MSKNRKSISVSFKPDSLEKIRHRHKNISLYLQKLVEDDLDRDSYRPVPKTEDSNIACMAKNAITEGKAVYSDSADTMPYKIKKIAFQTGNTNYYAHKSYGMKLGDVVHISISENLGHGKSISSSLYATADDSAWIDDVFTSAASTAILPLVDWRRHLPFPDDQMSQMHYSGTLLEAAGRIRKDGNVRLEVSATFSKVMDSDSVPTNGSVILSAELAEYPPGYSGYPFSVDTSDEQKQ